MATRKKFGLIGAAAYVAPRHMQAIVDTGNELVCALDPYDNVGILDRYSNDCQFFTELERFDRHLRQRRREGEPIDWLTVCTPNYLHDSHITTGLRNYCNVICEKPLTLTRRNLDELELTEHEFGRRVYTILQLRLHEAVLDLKRQAETWKDRKQIDLTYIATRGPWYLWSWKGDPVRSGGHCANIGIHFLDMLLWIFGRCEIREVHWRDRYRTSGFLQLERADVRWFLSIDPKDLPDNVLGPTFRCLEIDGKKWEFSGGFEYLHTESYRKILDGEGCGITQARPSIELAYALQHDQPDLAHTDSERIHASLLNHYGAFSCA